eukprot:3425688-Karenia_brevis.AAC.1
MVALLDRFKRLCPNLEEVLFEEGDPKVVGELQRRIDKVDASSLAYDKNTVDIHMKAFSVQRLRWGAEKPKDSTLASKWYQTLLSREKDCIIYEQKVNPNTMSCDVSQSIGRIPKTKIIKI